MQSGSAQRRSLAFTGLVLAEARSAEQLRGLGREPLGCDETADKVKATLKGFACHHIKL